jgi:hypothetical protein
VTVLVLGAVGYFFWRALADNWDRVRELDFSITFGAVLGFLLLVAAVPLSGLLWAHMLRMRLGVTAPSLRDTIATHCLSWVLKYIPGQVGSVANKVLWAQRRGISRVYVSITFVYENVFLQLASIVPSVVIISFALGAGIFTNNPATLLLPLVAIVPLLLLAHGPTFHRLSQWGLRKILKRELNPEYFLTSREALLLQLEFLAPRVLNAIGFVLIAASVVPIEPTEWLPLGAAYVLAGAVGILAFFVPSGLGVREAVIVLIASQYMSVADAVVISLLTRLYATVADAAVAALYFALRARPSSPPTTSSSTESNAS